MPTVEDKPARKHHAKEVHEILEKRKLCKHETDSEQKHQEFKRQERNEGINSNDKSLFCRQILISFRDIKVWVFGMNLVDSDPINEVLFEI